MKAKPTFNLFSLKRKEQTGIQRQMSTLVIGVAALLLLALTTWVQASASEGLAAASLQAAVVTPTAIMESEAENEATTGSAFLAENPELLKIHPPAEGQAMTESEFLAANPELKHARRYMAAIATGGGQPAPPPADSEAVRAQNCTAFRDQKALDAFLEANPELRFARTRLDAAVVYAEELPIAADAQSVSYNAAHKQIDYTSFSTVEALAAFYQETLLALGWQEDRFFSTYEKGVVQIPFRRGESSLVINISNNDLAEKTEVTIRTNCVMWQAS